MGARWRVGLGGRGVASRVGDRGLSTPVPLERAISWTTREPRALIVYAADEWPLRTAIADHLFAWQRHGPFDTVYFNAKRRRLTPRHLRDGFDLIVFHTTVLGQRWNAEAFERVRDNLRPLASVIAPRLAIPQDEFFNTRALGEFLAEFDVDHVLSCAPSSEWPKIYGSLSERARFATVMTGYLEPRTVARVERLRTRAPDPRPIDIGYRAWRAQPWLGRHGMLKTSIGEAVLASAAARTLNLDVSLDDRGTLVGNAWWRFLLSCRFVVGVEGGSSLLDADGSVKACTEAYLAAHPGASFADVEAACFPGRDGELDLVAISPRHLEACATRTGQLLVEGHYNGVLRPGEHYIPIRSDLSDLEEALAQVSDQAALDAMSRRAFGDVVASDRHTYRTFIREALDLLGDAVPASPFRQTRPRSATLRAGLATVPDVRSRWALAFRGLALRRLEAVNLLGPARRSRRWLGRMLRSGQ